MLSSLDQSGTNPNLNQSPVRFALGLERADESRMEEKLRRAVEPLMENVRVLRKECYLCSAKCCDSTDTREKLGTCVEACQRRVIETEKVLAAELQEFHGRLQRCVLACKDEAEALPKFRNLPNLDAAKRAKLQATVDAMLEVIVDSCNLKCVDDQMATLRRG